MISKTQNLMLISNFESQLAWNSTKNEKYLAFKDVNLKKCIFSTSGTWSSRCWKRYTLIYRGGHRHLQIGGMLDIDLISEPPTPTPPRCMYPKCGNLCGQRGRKRFIACWSLRMSHICPCIPSPPRIGQRSKVVILPTTANILFTV